MTLSLIGAIAGDECGSAYEFNNHRSMQVNLFHPESTFTDDTVLTVAVADALLHGKELARTIWEYGRKYPNRGYGNRFSRWLLDDALQPYNSFGNGSAMRVSPVGFAFDDPDKALKMAKATAEVTHNHPEGIKGAQATAIAICLARTGSSKEDISLHIVKKFGYNLSFTTDEIRETNKFNETCQITVPQAIVSFLESTDYEDAIRRAISIGGDSDTMACITGGIAIAFYKEMPETIKTFVFEKLPTEFKEIIENFDEKFRKLLVNTQKTL